MVLDVVFEIVVGVILLRIALGDLQIQPIPEKCVEFVLGILSEQVFDMAPILVVELLLPVGWQ